MTQKTGSEEPPVANDPLDVPSEQPSNANTDRAWVNESSQEGSDGADTSSSNSNVWEAGNDDPSQTDHDGKHGDHSAMKRPSQVYLARTSEGRGRTLLKEVGDYMNKGQEQPSAHHVEAPVDYFMQRRQDPPEEYFTERQQEPSADYFAERHVDVTSPAQIENDANDNDTELQSTGQRREIGATRSSVTEEPGISRQDFNDGAETGNPEDTPIGSRFRRESIQIATRLLEKHSRNVHVRFWDSDTVVEESTRQMEVPIDRSASPTVYDNHDDLGLAMTNSPVGVLGMLLDLYKLQRDDYLDVIDHSEASSRRVSSASNRAAGSQASSEPGSVKAKQANTDDEEGVGSSSTLNDEIYGEVISPASIGAAARKGSLGSHSRSGPRRRRKMTSKDRRSGGQDNQALTQIGLALRSHILRQLYIVKLCRALMTYGAPTHRLEAYLLTSARSMGLNAQFMYLPNCMFISFVDDSSQTTKVTIVTSNQVIDLGRMRDTHEIYLHVVHKIITVEEAMDRLEEVMCRGPKFKPWFRVLMYGCASACVTPFGFQGRFVDLPIAFLLGLILGTLHLILAPANSLFCNIFEITASIIISFLARVFGSINGGSIFCFSALTQGGIALILPGYMVLCASLELQMKNLVAGAVRLTYATFYTLFLGYGITIGTVLYGFMNKNATSEVICRKPLSKEWDLLFVILFAICSCVIYQAKWKQIPLMLFIAVGGYVVNWQTSLYFRGASTVSNTLSSLAIGLMANLYSKFGRYPSITAGTWTNYAALRFERWLQQRRRRKERPDVEKGRPPLRPAAMSRSKSTANIPKRVQAQVGYGLASAAMIPAIMVQVPSGIAVGGSLIAGVSSADWIVSSDGSTTAIDDLTASSNVAFNVTIAVVQVAISISVGLSLASLLVHPREWMRGQERKIGFSAL